MKNTFNDYDFQSTYNESNAGKVSTKEYASVGVFNYGSVWEEYYNAAADSADDYIEMMAD